MIKINTIISNGLAYGKTVRIENETKKIDVYSSNAEAEIELFDHAINKSIADLISLEKDLSEHDKEFVNIHKMLISDPMLRVEVVKLIENESLSASSAFVRVTDNYIKAFKEARTTYLSERALDMEDIKRRVLNNFGDDDVISVEGEFILVVDELYPSYLMTYANQIIGVIANKGGFTSHSAILCKSREIPYVVLDDLSMVDGNVMIDTRREVIITNPTESQINEYKLSIYNKDNFKINDFHSFGIGIYGNVSSNNDINKIIKYNMDGVGLYRTELIFMNLDKPMSYEEQLKVYKDAATMLPGKKLTFRTFDIGDDKQLSYIKTYHKGIDNYKNNPEVFETQIKALLNANVNNNIRIMFPMIETVEEYQYLKEWTLRIKKEINNESSVRLGMMLETKKAVENIESFKGVDFMSLGTNDLTKELYNISREEQVNYQMYIKDLLVVLEKVVDSCKKNNIDLSICGELAGVKSVARMLYRSGIRNYSISASNAKNLNDALMAEIEE